jgi:hypothetical protein
MGDIEDFTSEYRFTTVYAEAVGLRFCSKTDFSSKGTDGSGSRFAWLQAFSQVRHPTHSVRSVSIPRRSGQPENFPSANASVDPPMSAAPPAAAKA